MLNSNGFNTSNSLMVIIIVLIFSVALIPFALSQSTKTTVVLYEEYQTKQFNEGQTVKLRGQVIYHTSEGGTGISNVYYKIIHQDSGQIIHDGRTSFDGTFSYDWSAKNFGNRETNLQAIFLGSGSYGYAESNTLTIEIFSKNPPAKKYHDVATTIQIEQGSSSDSIRVNPTITYDYGISLPYGYTIDGNSNFVEIHVNNYHTASVMPNQWSSDIYVGHGTHSVFAQSQQFTDNTSGDVFRKSKSAALSISLKSPPVVQQPPQQPTQQPTQQLTQTIIPQSSAFDPTLIVILAIIGAIGGGTGIALSKRKKSLPNITASVCTRCGASIPKGSKFCRKCGMSTVITTPDDTQFWVCPHCGNDTVHKNGKQYCNICSIYLQN